MTPEGAEAERETIARFLLALHPTPARDEYAELRCLDLATGRRRQFWYADPGALAAQAVRADRAGYDPYVGVHLRSGREGGNAAVGRAMVLPADVDDALFEHDAVALRRVLATFPLRPSVAVLSGRGLHLYWRLRTPLDLQDPVDLATYRLLAGRLARAVCGPGRKPDTIGDPARILRLPCTHNRKHGLCLPVSLLWCEPERRYGHQALGAWLDHHAPWSAPPPLAARSTHSSQRRQGCAGWVIADFNERYDVLGLLLARGARIERRAGETVYLTRPGKSRGVSASWNHVPGMLVMFSVAWPPFEPQRGYDAFAVYTLLEHAGDRRRAHAAAWAEGFGRPPRSSRRAATPILLSPTWQPGDPLCAVGAGT